VGEGKYAEAHKEFIQLAEDTPDPLEKAWPLIYAANTLQTLGQEEAATAQLSAVRTLVELEPVHVAEGCRAACRSLEHNVQVMDAGGP
jgi:hypothetical protein